MSDNDFLYKNTTHIRKDKINVKASYRIKRFFAALFKLLLTIFLIWFAVRMVLSFLDPLIFDTKGNQLLLESDLQKAAVGDFVAMESDKKLEFEYDNVFEKMFSMGDKTVDLYKVVQIPVKKSNNLKSFEQSKEETFVLYDGKENVEVDENEIIGLLTDEQEDLIKLYEKQYKKEKKNKAKN